jgi:integrase
MYFETVDWATSKPSIRSSPWIRDAPHRGFSLFIRWIRSRRPLSILGRPALFRDLIAALSAAQRTHVLILTTEYGKPFSVDGFGQWMRDAITAAGLPLECQPHGLRKAAGRRLAESGASSKMVMAVLGHRTLSEVERYTEDADQVGLALEAVSKLEGHKWNEIAQTSSDGLGKTAKTDGESK